MNNALIASFWESGWFGRIIMIILFCLSIYAWAIIFMKWYSLNKIKRSSDAFLKLIQNTGENIFLLYQKGAIHNDSPFATLYKTISKEVKKISGANGLKHITNSELNNINELAIRTISSENLSMGKYLIVLATTASISPLLGLLGTVWGVLISFRGIGMLGSADLTVVAPGISEALVTTVAGLIVAIPALIGYNGITNKLRIFTEELENFSSYLISNIQANYSLPPTSYEKEPAF